MSNRKNPLRLAFRAAMCGPHQRDGFKIGRRWFASKSLYTYRGYVAWRLRQATERRRAGDIAFAKMLIGEARAARLHIERT